MRPRLAILAGAGAAAVAAALAILLVVSSRNERPAGSQTGDLRPEDPQSTGSQEAAPGTSPEDLKRRLDQLRSVPYTALTQEEAGDEPTGVLVYKRDAAYPGYNLYCSRVSPQAFLMDMEGRIVHTWTYPERRARLSERNHAIMLANGDAVIINEPRQLWRLDWQSNVIWEKDIAADHDIIQASDSSFYVIVVEVKKYRGLAARFPSIVHLSPGGRELDRWSSYDHLDEIRQAFDQRSSLDAILDSLAARGGMPPTDRSIPGRLEVNLLKGETVYDGLHLNTLNLLPDTPLGRLDRRFAAGNLLICFRNINQIAVLDRDTKAILWVWGEGDLQWPHHPTMLAGGNILVFDNGVKRGYSRVLELNPAAGTIEWQYVARPPGSFYTYEKGSAQRLANGNTLICEGDEGRAFEVTLDGQIVWEWLNPATRTFRRVQLYRMIRVPREVAEPLLERGAHLGPPGDAGKREAGTG